MIVRHSDLQDYKYSHREFGCLIVLWFYLRRTLILFQVNSSSSQTIMSQSIKVVVRIRPINSKQKALECKTIVSADEAINQITIFKPDEPENLKSFAYDHVFPDNCLQSNVYAKTAYSLVENVLQGYNGTIFAYGQTGCGKTHSMVGKLDVEQLQGIIPRSFGHLLNSISETKNRQFLIRCSFIEIYNEEVRDLLGKDIKKGLQIKQSPEKGVFIKDLSSNPAKTHQELMEYMNLGNKNRSVGETAMNKDSSRSHLLFMLYLQSADLSIPEEKRKYIASKLNLVDLAGSERINKTGAQGDRLQEAKNINLSLSALGNVISALVDGKSHHIPYRDSKLTRLLQDSLGGNTKTVMVANCSPADYNFDETLSTLRYASRAKFIKNKPIINEDPKDALLKEYANEIKKLKEILSKQGGSAQWEASPDIVLKTDNYDKIKQKEQELADEKLQTKMLQEKLKALERQHLYSQNVRVDTKIKEKINQVRKSVFAPASSPQSVLPVDGQKLSQLQANTSPENSRQIVKLLKCHIKSLENEIKDVEHENYLDKEMLLGDIRNLARENKLLQGILNILLSPKEVEKVKAKVDSLESQQKGSCDNRQPNYGYDEDKNRYHIPAFTLKEKQIIFPKLGNQEWAVGMELRNNSKQDDKIINNSSLHGQSESGGSQNEESKYLTTSKLGNNSGVGVPDKLKNNSFIFGKGGKENKKNVISIRDVIQEARQSNQTYVTVGQVSPNLSVKKSIPWQLEPLNKPELSHKLQKLAQNEREAGSNAERPRKLQKLVNYPCSARASLASMPEQ